MNITPRSSKDEVITAACELTDIQAAQIKDLKGKKNTLLFLLVVLTSVHLLFESRLFTDYQCQLHQTKLKTKFKLQLD